MDRLTDHTSSLRAASNLIREHGANLAMNILHGLESMGHTAVPELPPLSPRLYELLRQSGSVPQDLKREHQTYVNARSARAAAKATNQRNLRSLLWAEAKLHQLGRDEWTVLRDFNWNEWGVEHEASFEVDVREYQLRHALGT